MGNQAIDNLKSLITIKLPSQEEVNNFNNANKNTGKILTLEYMQNQVYILQHGFSIYNGQNIKTYKLNPLDYRSLPGYNLTVFENSVE